MPRKGPAPLRDLPPDPQYNDVLVAHLINKVLMRGKKGRAYKIVYGAFDIIARKTGQDPAVVFKKALDNVRPVLEVRSRRVGGATYQIPMEVSERRANSLAFRWIVSFARSRREKTMQERLANELIDASKGTGPSIKKKEDVHKMAEANKAFAHYRW